METRPNFLVYGKQEFKNVFPFDTLGEITTSGNNNCPKLEVLGHEKELCEIPEAIEKFKYPVWIVFIIRLILAS